MTKLCKHHCSPSTYILLISAKFANEVLLAPARSTCGGLITIFFFSPVAISGFFSRIMSNTRVSNCKYGEAESFYQKLEMSTGDGGIPAYMAQKLVQTNGKTVKVEVHVFHNAPIFVTRVKKSIFLW